VAAGGKSAAAGHSNDRISSAGSPSANAEAAAFRKGLSEMGFVLGRNVTIEYRNAEDQNDPQRLQALAVELVRLRVAVIFASGGAFTVPAAKAATATTRFVFTTGADPVQTGMVTSLNRRAAMSQVLPT